MKTYITYLLGGIATALLVALIVLNLGITKMSPKKAGEFTVNYIQENLAPDLDFTYKEAKKISGIYEVVFEVMGSEDKAYVTTDGKYLFFQPINMKPTQPQELPKTEKPKIDLFVMSYCPYGNQAEELLMPIVDLFGNKIDVELHYILYSNYASGYPEFCYDEGELYCSMHAIGELNQGVRELCVQKYQPNKFWDFVKAANDQATSNNIDDLWEDIAIGVDVDVDQVKNCFSNEIEDILANELSLTNVDYPVQEPKNHEGQETDNVAGSPTLIINGMFYDGSRSVGAYQEAICSAFKNIPDECDIKLNDDGTTPDSSCEI